METDLGCIEHNLINIRRLIGHRELTLMIKANAYNHGVKGVVSISEGIVDRYGVATLSEAIELKSYGVRKPISIFSYNVDDIPYIIENKFTPIIYNHQSLDALIKNRYQDFDIKIDSGMNRFGFNNHNDISTVIKKLKKAHLEPRVLLTHFASNERVDEQILCFQNLANPFVNEYVSIKSVLSATSGILQGHYFDGVRAGLIAYKGSLRVVSRILDIKYVRAGAHVGYDGDYVPTKSTRIAIISGGYFDGIKRSYKGASVIVGDAFAHIVGKISMDTTLVDIGEISAKVGDRVIILDNATINSYCLADNTNEYEIITSIKGRGKRIYKYHGKEFN